MFSGYFLQFINKKSVELFKKSVIMVNVREMAAHFFTENFKLDRRISTWLQKSYVWEQNFCWGIS